MNKFRFKWNVVAFVTGISFFALGATAQEGSCSEAFKRVGESSEKSSFESRQVAKDRADFLKMAEKAEGYKEALEQMVRENPGDPYQKERLAQFTGDGLTVRQMVEEMRRAENEHSRDKILGNDPSSFNMIRVEKTLNAIVAAESALRESEIAPNQELQDLAQERLKKAEAELRELYRIESFFLGRRGRR